MEYTKFDPLDFESIKRFLKSAKSIINRSNSYAPTIVSEALNESWNTYAKNVDTKALTDETRRALNLMTKKFPGFSPIRESGKDALLPAKGKGLPQGSASGEMPEMKEPKFSDISTKNELIKRKPKSDLESTPEVSGTGFGYDGKGKAPKMEALSKQDPILMENVAKLTRHIRKNLTEAAKGNVRTASYAMLVRESEEIAKTPTRYSLAEAIADAEELLLFHRPEDVKMVVNYTSDKGRTGRTTINMMSVKARDPIFSEGKTLFRFQRNAENFARELAAEGITCRLSDHNWGFSLIAESKASNITKTFRNMI